MTTKTEIHRRVLSPEAASEEDNERFWSQPEQSPVEHKFHVFEARTGPKEKMVSIEMPSPKYKMLCGAVTAKGNTVVLGSFPETANKWVAVHDPARQSAYIILKVLALVESDEQNPRYETTIKRLALSSLTSAGSMEELVQSSSWGGLDPSSLVTFKGRFATLHCPISAKYTLCGGGFYASIPIVGSAPVSTSSYPSAMTTRREQSGFGGGGWAVTCDRHNSLVAFAVGIRMRKSGVKDMDINDAAYLTTTPVATGIHVTLDGGHWRGVFPPPHNDVVFYLGSCDRQDPASTALYLKPSVVAKSAISKAPPTLWAQYHTPYRTDGMRADTAAAYCRTTKK